MAAAGEGEDDPVGICEVSILKKTRALPFFLFQITQDSCTEMSFRSSSRIPDDLQLKSFLSRYSNQVVFVVSSVAPDYDFRSATEH